MATLKNLSWGIALGAFLISPPVLAGEIRIQNIWAELEPDAFDGDVDLDVYMRIVNSGAKADRLYAVRTRDAEEAHLNAVSNEQERLMKASSAGELSEGLRATAFRVEPGQILVLESEGPHIQLEDLEDERKVGDTVKLTLFFEQIGPVELRVLIKED
jgi:copper(I)-binding protein